MREPVRAFSPYPTRTVCVQAATNPRLRTMRVPWTGREEDRDDPGVWTVSCFVVRTGFRRRVMRIDF